ncbi:hypothetical protein OEZ85_010720 [Tetradesmus obliquus]|uniref:[histone H3]-lysine(4) N-trimethyltransferase n=1 Tax=Tetradesmus obliquus TaxID=3088 RepID=A0ABY8TQ81_TETOB|nr:hypothetical protein OEZ85_010720 [Tetradesmus obliquus]
MAQLQAAHDRLAAAKLDMATTQQWSQAAVWCWSVSPYEPSAEAGMEWTGPESLADVEARFPTGMFDVPGSSSGERRPVYVCAYDGSDDCEVVQLSLLQALAWFAPYEQPPQPGEPLPFADLELAGEAEAARLQLLQCMEALRTNVRMLALASAAYMTAVVTCSSSYLWHQPPPQLQLQHTWLDWHSLQQAVAAANLRAGQVWLQQHPANTRANLAQLQQSLASFQALIDAAQRGMADSQCILQQLPPFEDATECWLLHGQQPAAATSQRLSIHDLRRRISEFAWPGMRVRSRVVLRRSFVGCEEALYMTDDEDESEALLESESEERSLDSAASDAEQQQQQQQGEDAAVVVQQPEPAAEEEQQQQVAAPAMSEQDQQPEQQQPEQQQEQQQQQRKSKGGRPRKRKDGGAAAGPAAKGQAGGSWGGMSGYNQAGGSSSSSSSAAAGGSRGQRSQLRAMVKGEAGASLGLSEAAKWKNLVARSKRVVFERSGVHGWGLFAGEEIGADEFIIQYVGELIRPVLSDTRERMYEAAGQDSSYLFRIDSDWVADATVRGGRARFINHSCDPNCYTKIFTVDGSRKIGIYAKKAIAPGQELAYDYKFDFEEDARRVPCACGAKNCRGFMN